MGKNFSIYRSDPFFLEVLPKGIDKAQSLERLLEVLGLTKEQMIACGDGYNDLTMIRYAGLGVAMENAVLPVRNAADTTWATVSWEEVVERAPEVIVINDYGSTSLEEKIEELKENPALADVPAIRDGRITSVTLCESFASSMTGDTIEKFARSFHPDCFQ